MLIIPAIDLKGGKCVRLLRGDFGAETVYGDDPVAMGRRWQDAGARHPHVVDLDGAHYKLVGDFDARFPQGPPSLVDCDRLEVRGDVTFGAGIVVRGNVTIDAASVGGRIADGTVLAG